MAECAEKEGGHAASAPSLRRGASAAGISAWRRCETMKLQCLQLWRPPKRSRPPRKKKKKIRTWHRLSRMIKLPVRLWWQNNIVFEYFERCIGH